MKATNVDSDGFYCNTISMFCGWEQKKEPDEERDELASFPVWIDWQRITFLYLVD